MASRISDPEQPKISLLSRIFKQDPTKIDNDNTREHLIDGDSSKQSYSLRAAILPFFFPALGGLLYGYDIGATSGATISLESANLSGTTWYNLNSLEIGLVVSGSLYGALVGSSLAFAVADYLGRRRELMFSSLAYLVGSLLTSLAPNFPVMVIGRLLYGIGIGLAMHAAPMYIAETAPSQIRGTLISLKEFFIVIGMLFGYISSSLYVDIVAGWRYMYGTSVPVGLIMCFGMWWLPPSPRWLLLCVIQGKGNISSVRTTAISCLCRLRGQSIDDKASDEIDAILHEISHDGQQRQTTFWEIFRGKCLKALFIGVGLLFFQQVTGQPSVLYYAAKILQSAGFSAASDATRVSVLLGLLKLAATGVAVLVVDRLGRRPLLIGGVSGIAFSLFLLSLYYTILKDLPAVAVVALLLYVGSYQLSFGPIGWLMISEIFPLRIRGRGLSIAVLVNFATNALVTFAFSPLQELVGTGILFAGFLVLALISLVFILFFIPETKGLTLEEIEANVL
ncbi:D-xylose-proton symporter-like 2 [Phalaenopsis equestris]|uniref:D-xylose-proton symporter-like 2 n=1 Tax=Phalaenopsis equestris TaxID=78828 RepID=UPI0009E2647D|nr:D-xylose-proton symporter-like 2 [Phalaenopsis equestris]